MAYYASVTYPGDGVTTQFALTFRYQSVVEVHVTINDAHKTLNTDYFIENGVVRFKTAPSASSRVRFYRNTSIAKAKVEWKAGATLSNSALTTNTIQLLYAIQELNDRLNTLTTVVTGGETEEEGEVTTDTMTPSILLERLVTFLSNKTTIEFPT